MCGWSILLCVSVLGFPGITRIHGRVARRYKRPQYAFLRFHANGVLGTARLYFWLLGHAPSCGRLCFRSPFDVFQRSQLPPQCRFPKPGIKAAPVWDLLNLKSSGTPPECLITFALKAMQSDAMAAHSGHLELQAWPPYLASILPDRIQQLNLDFYTTSSLHLPLKPRSCHLLQADLTKCKRGPLQLE